MKDIIVEIYVTGISEAGITTRAVGNRNTDVIWLNYTHTFPVEWDSVVTNPVNEIANKFGMLPSDVEVKFKTLLDE